VFLEGNFDAQATDIAITTLLGLSSIGGGEVLQR
jgi:hypothetical protein